MVAERRRRMKQRVFLLGILITGLLIRIIFLNQHDIWFDEAFSFFVTNQSISNLLQATATDNNPPLYYIILHGWMQLFGNSIMPLRSLSLIFGIASISVYWLFTKFLFNKQTAIYATALFTLSPLMIYFSTETRMYSLFVFLTLLATYSWICLLKKISVKYATIFFLSFTLSLYTHYYAYLLFVAFIVSLFLFYKKLKAILLLLLVLPVLLTIPWFLQYLKHAHPAIYTQQVLFAIPATFASFVLGGTGIVTLRTYFGEVSPLWTKLFFSLTIIVFLLLAFKGLKQRFNAKNGKLIIFFLGFPLLFLTITNLFVPVFSVRSTIFLAPFFYLLIALGMHGLAKKLQNIALLTMCLLFLMVNTIVLISPLFKGPQIKDALNKTDDKNLLAHTSILTYYPFQYYSPNSNNILISSNPLTPQTISIIGGKKKSLPSKLSQFVLIEVAAGIDEQELKITKRNLDKNYKVLSKKQYGTITLSIYKKLF